MKKRKILAIILCCCISCMFLAELPAAASETIIEESEVNADTVSEHQNEEIQGELKTDAEEETASEELQAVMEEEGETSESLGELEYSMEGSEITSIDENGNVFIVEDQGDGVVDEIRLQDEMFDALQIVNFRANAAGRPVTTTTEYTEYRTGAIGYTYGRSGADAAYLGTENGKVKFMLSGVVGLVDASKVQVVSLASAKSYSSYYANGTRLIHQICMDMTTPGYGGKIDVGPQQPYMSAGATYFSYDGHYFYTSYEMMISDYKNETRRNSINPGSPYYNYFQYLPLRGKSGYTQNELKTAVNGRAASDSKMYNTGNLFVDNQNTYGVNALLMVGIGANESAWGASSIAKNKNNLFGINAVDSSPGSSATSFSSVNACIKDFAETYMSKRYLRAGYTYYNGGFCGDKASGINVRYASDPYWGEKAAAIAWSLDNSGGKKDQNKYSVGIKDPIATGHTELNIRKEASASAPILYNTGRVSNYAFLILEETEGFYKIQSDPVLTGDRSRTDPNTGVYNSGAMYAYVSRDYVRPVSGKVPDTAPSPSQPPSSSSMLTYNSHVQTHGWMGYIPEGEISGTSGEAKRLEAIRIRLNNPDYEGSVEYCTHVQTYGWQEWKSDDAVSGTQGEAKRMEAIRIRLTGEMAENYDIYYRTHVQTYGWLDWAKNGEIAGSTDASKRMEALQIKLVKKGGAAPGNEGRPYVQPILKYRTHVQTYGWQDYVTGGTHSGTTGSAKRLEAIQISLNNTKYSGNLRYKVHVQTYGWQEWKEGGAVAGTTGQAKRLEAIRIELTGQMAEKYDVYYRGHSQTYGWLGWAKNGEPAGTEGLAKRLEALQIVLIPKGGEAPGSTENSIVKN